MPPAFGKLWAMGGASEKRAEKAGVGEGVDRAVVHGADHVHRVEGPAGV